MKHLSQHIKESIFDGDLVDKHVSTLYEISLMFFEKMMKCSTLSEWNKCVVELNEYLKKSKTDNISFEEYNDQDTYQNGVMTIVPLTVNSNGIDKDRWGMSVVISYKNNNRHHLYEFRPAIFKSGIIPQYYFWARGIPKTSLPENKLMYIKKMASKRHDIYKISFTESDLEMFNKVSKRK